MLNIEKNILNNFEELSEEELQEWCKKNFDKISKIIYNNKNILYLIVSQMFK